MSPTRTALDHIPVIDLEDIGTSPFDDIPDVLWKTKAKEVHNALSNIGFMYLINHGIPQEKIERVIEASRNVFFLSNEEKETIKYNNEAVQGFVIKGTELLHSTSKYELREAYDVSRFDRPLHKCVPHLKEALKEYTEETFKLIAKIFKLMALALGLDADFFNKTHTGFLKEGNGSVIRVARYPPIEEEVGEGVVRCGEHSDYGSISILAQDDCGGLEVKNVDGAWVKATPIPNSLVINLGDLMEFWTSGIYPATRHRILVPTEESLRNRERYCLAFFIHPRADTPVTPIGQKLDELHTITCGEYMVEKRNRIYGA